jgi:glutathione S-transferase
MEDLQHAFDELRVGRSWLQACTRYVARQSDQHVTLGDFVLAYTLDWGNEAKLLGDCPELKAYMERMYKRPNAPPRISEALAAVSR